MHEEAKKYKHRWTYQLTDSYIFPEDLEEWDNCPVCNAKPKVWEFNNGRYASCRCHNSEYDHHIIYAESIMSCYINDNGSLKNHKDDGLKNNWNTWCRTGEVLFSKPSIDGRW